MRALFVSIAVFLVSSLGLAGFYVTKSSSINNDKQPEVLAAATVVSAVDREIMSKINAVRSQAGVENLNFSDNLKQLTTVRSTDMAVNNYYSHTNPEGYDFGDMIREYDPLSRNSCENLQLQVGDNWQSAVDAWIASSAHYKCLVNPALTRAAGSVVEYGEVSYDDTDSSKQMYVFTFIATN